MKHRLTGYSHPGCELLGRHAERLAKRPNPAILGKLKRRDIAEFLEPFLQLAELNYAKSFCHRVLGVESEKDPLTIHDERKNNLSLMTVVDKKILVIATRRVTELPVREPHAIIRNARLFGSRNPPEMPPFEVVITHLELAPADFKPKRSPRPDVSFSHVTTPVPELNRFFYAAIGGQWFWLDRRPWSLARWTEHLADQNRIDTWILSVGGVPAGYVELERKDAGTVEIDYLGLLSAFIGGGLGAHLLTCGVERAIEMGASKVLVNTCNLDHPKARANYEARGFRAVRTEVKTKEIPSLPPGPWDGA